MTHAIARFLPRMTSESRADAGLNLAVYGAAAIVCGISPPGACAMLLGWALWRKRRAARETGARVLSVGGPVFQGLGLSLLVVAAMIFAVLMAPELPAYSSPILTEVLPPIGG
ncbi:hypothetical protein [Ovoidimarina sediminis]|uniref:hypothetical protein n=1 Tax=Ovoidimarina sediminis TaxID=3079856 RepID=UPI0029147D59|nr:hypothetical protein [Rhodophyticola sp. MJ-SS7]MDU8942709.1 hypothetical protein [Rhodophyticola sp. MJ-SS7]